MKLTPDQIKGRIKNIAKTNNADARVLLRIYMMDRFLERLAYSKYRNNFIIKGGVLVTALVGINNRSTNDIDVSIKNQNLSIDDIISIINEIKDINLDDGVKFEINDISNIMDQMEYPGVRVSMNASLDGLLTPLKIDISTGDVITPKEISFDYKLLLEDRYVQLWSYNLETVFAEKLQTILARGILNTRMRDFYDIYILVSLYNSRINKNVLNEAFINTCEKRNTKYVISDNNQILKNIENDDGLKSLWKKYQEKFQYASDIEYTDIINSISSLLNKGEKSEEEI